MTISACLDGIWRDWFPLEFIMASSMVYELIERAAAKVFSSELGMAYLGPQERCLIRAEDMALAMLGGMMASGVMTLLRQKLSDAISSH